MDAFTRWLKFWTWPRIEPARLLRFESSDPLLTKEREIVSRFVTETVVVVVVVVGPGRVE